MLKEVLKVEKKRHEMKNWIFRKKQSGSEMKYHKHEDSSDMLKITLATGIMRNSTPWIYEIFTYNAKQCIFMYIYEYEVSRKKMW